MRWPLPEWKETRIIKRFAVIPLQANDENGDRVRIWLEPYYQKQTATYSMGRFTGWKSDYWPATNREGG